MNATARTMPLAAAVPTPQELVDRARAMIPTLKARAAETDRLQRVPDSTMREFHEAGFFKPLLPRRFGGYEMEPQVVFDVQMTLAEGCMSSAWVQGLLAVHSYQLALFDARAQDEVWSSAPDALISSTYQPVGKVTRVEGGYRLSGHWGFSSGAEHCTWMFLGSLAPPVSEGSPPEMLTFLLPRSDYELVAGSWDTFGLKGTGSVDVIVKDAFIPFHRTHSALEGFEVATQKGLSVNTAPLFRIPWAQIFMRSVSSASIGALQGALNAFVDIGRARVSTNTGKATRQDPAALNLAARAQSEILQLKAQLHRNFDVWMDAVSTGRDVPVLDRARHRYEASQVARRCAALVDEMMPLLGGRAIYNHSPMVRYWLDLNAARAHVANDPGIIGGSVGAMMMGQTVFEAFT